MSNCCGPSEKKPAASKQVAYSNRWQRFLAKLGGDPQFSNPKTDKQKTDRPKPGSCCD